MLLRGGISLGVEAHRSRAQSVAQIRTLTKWKTSRSSKQTQLDAQILPRVLAKVIEELYHFAGGLIQVVVEFVVVKKLARRPLSLIEFFADGTKGRYSRLQIIV